MADITTIKISKKNKERLEKLRVYKRESYDEMIQRILDILNLCRSDPERARHRLILFERQSGKPDKSTPTKNIQVERNEKQELSSSEKIPQKFNQIQDRKNSSMIPKKMNKLSR